MKSPCLILRHKLIKNYCKYNTMVIAIVIGQTTDEQIVLNFF